MADEKKLDEIDFTKGEGYITIGPDGEPMLTDADGNPVKGARRLDATTEPPPPPPPPPDGGPVVPPHAPPSGPEPPPPPAEMRQPLGTGRPGDTSRR